MILKVSIFLGEDPKTAMPNHAASRRFIAYTFVIILALFGRAAPASASPPNLPPDIKAKPSETVHVERLTPEWGHGQGYRLVYFVDVPIAAFWKFKIDFDNDFVIENKYIREHRLIWQTADAAVTENKYTFGPDVFFRWRTTLHRSNYRMEFVLLNPEQCRQRYQYGHIQLEPAGSGTRVIQEAYFDFLGASFWAHYPWEGGMQAFLTYTAQWEQKTALRLKDRYADINHR